MKLFSYIITHDTGFTPNPFWGCRTNADRKPAIRCTANVGEWVVGLSPKAIGNRVVYAMKVDEILDYASYLRDKRFAKKIPNYSDGKVVCKAGNKIYRPLPNGEFKQLRSIRSNGNEENSKSKSHDVGGRNALVGRHLARTCLLTWWI